MSNYRRALIASAIFAPVMLLVYYIHMRYFRVNVVLYASVLDVFVAVVLVGAVLSLRGFLSAMSGLERLLLFALWVATGYAFAVSVPTIIDRSLSFYILEKLQQRGGGIRQGRMKDVFVNEYMVEHHLVDIRLTEQLQSGTIEIHDGCVHLTPKGEFVASMGRFYRTHFLPRHRLLMGQYTDDLTDPFRHSTQNVDYRCE
ncbi:hypothetical protein RKE25_19330 [Dyella sp. BiH032]|uniref:hypothetical protein n=1 Tax=Dyella sp. BiH032 TaxID=3075430 RepID=UPI0028929838|nr:hypothetical protein [Dyella sp. BiH032]WNL45541.1 hypothetical protein RKE25_19330 [Dyella sp. BiH032]